MHYWDIFLGKNSSFLSQYTFICTSPTDSKVNAVYVFENNDNSERKLCSTVQICNLASIK